MVTTLLLLIGCALLAPALWSYFAGVQVIRVPLWQRSLRRVSGYRGREGDGKA